jgi:putative ABC transport system permease protein
MKLLRKIRALFRKQKLETEMAEEMRLHLEQRARENISTGMSPEEARYAALRKFGGIEQIKERARDQRTIGWLADFVRDLRFAFRQLARTPGFTLIAIITLGLGIGANTAMFSMLNAILLKPLPFADAGRLDRLYRSTNENPWGNFSAADFLDLQAAAGGYGKVSAYAYRDLGLSDPGQPAEIARAARVSANFFSLLGTAPELGRDFHAGEDLFGNHRVLIISHRCWQNRYGSDPRIIGRTVRVDGEPNEIVGVLPASFNDWRYLGWIDLFRPLGLSRAEAADRTTTWIGILGRRAEGRSAAEAAGFLASFGRRLAKQYPAVNAGSTWLTLSLYDALNNITKKSVLSMLIGLSGFVLLIACSNLANLFLARTMARAREFAVRSALGASRAQLLRPLVAESLLLAFAGGLFALLVAVWNADWLAYVSTGENGDSVVFPLDWSVLGWAFAASLATALFFGLVPAQFALGLDANGTLKGGARGTTGGRGHQRLRHILIVGQFALAMMLLAGAALFVRGVRDLNSRRYGWESERVVTGTILLPTANYAGDDEMAAFHRLALERLEALPGVKSASLSTTMPFVGLAGPRRYLVAGRATPEPGHEPAAMVNSVSPHYFETVGTRLLAGRAFNAGDTRTSPRVFIISQSTATGLFSNENPLGRRLAQAGGATLEWGKIVGVAADIESVNPQPGPVNYQLYEPMAQDVSRQSEIAVRTNGVAPSALVDGIRSAMTALNPDLPVHGLAPADTVISQSNYMWGVLGGILSALALLGLGLASLGIYGIVARMMAQRTVEFGIRLALGAQLNDITRIVLGTGVRLALIGSAIGLLGAYGLSRLIAMVFPGMRTDSVPVVAGTTVLLIAVALIACWLPARRAAKVDPMIALRAE